MTSSESIVADLINAAARASSSSNADFQDFDTVVSETRRSFRRRSVGNGRKKKTTVKKNVFLFRRSNVDFLPTTREAQYLNENNLGKREKAVFERCWNLAEIENYIQSLYPHVPLNLIGFQLAKCSQSRKVTILTNVANMENILMQINQGTIFIIPNRDIPMDEVRLRSRRDEDTIVYTVSKIRMNSMGISETDISGRTNLRSNNHTRGRSEIVAPVPQENPAPAEEIYHVETTPQSFGLDESEPCEIRSHHFIIPTLPEDTEKLNLIINRSNCCTDLFQFYSNESVTDKLLSVTFINEQGLDGGGLIKEMFNLFFGEIEDQFFRGEDCIVPFLPLNRTRKDNNKFILIGRALLHMILLTGNVPSKFSELTLTSIGTEDMVINQNNLLEQFYLYVNPCERAILKKAITNFKLLNRKEVEILNNIFTSHQFYELPSEMEIRDQLISIASDVLLEKPKPFINLIRQGVSLEKYSSFWRECDFSIFLDFQKPTPDKVVNCLKTNDDLTNEETTVLHYLEMYIRCLDNDSLRQFVFFTTGSYQMPDVINVSFSNIVGLARRPIISTCANSVELPTSYCSYQELKKEFNICLFSEEAYVYNTY